MEINHMETGRERHDDRRAAGGRDARTADFTGNDHVAACFHNERPVAIHRDRSRDVQREVVRIRPDGIQDIEKRRREFGPRSVGSIENRGAAWRRRRPAGPHVPAAKYPCRFVD